MLAVNFLFRCPQCRTRRKQWKLMEAHKAKHQHFFCHCGGYHFKHRKGSPYCHHNPLSPIRQVARDYGDDECTIQGLARSITEERPELTDKVRFLMERLGIEFNNEMESV